MVLGADISNYARVPTVETLKKVRAAGVRHLIVRLSFESEALRQISIRQLANARAAGLSTSGYTWAYPNLAELRSVFTPNPFSGYRTADIAMQIAVEAGSPLATLWFDFEEGSLQGDQIGPWMAEAARGAGSDQRIGIYTRRGWWQDHGDPNIAPDEYPLLDAHYDGNAQIGANFVPYGPWSFPSGKQYTNTTVLRGLSCDRDVLLPEICRI